MEYSEKDKPGAPHRMMRNAFIDMSIRQLLMQLETLQKEKTDAQNTIYYSEMEIKTIIWELSYR